MWDIRFTDTSQKQLSKLDRAVQRRIVKYLSERLSPIEDPRQLGHGLTGELAQYWRYRVGDYRLICEIQDDVLTVLVVTIGHRREVYR